MKIILVLGTPNDVIMKKRVDRAMEEFYRTPHAIISDYTGETTVLTQLLLSGAGISTELKLEYMNKIGGKYILSETQSRNTVENLIYTKQILDEMFTKFMGFQPEIVICTSSFHVKRVIILAKLILTDYSYTFIHTREPITKEEYQNEASILNHSIDTYINKCIDYPVVVV